MYQFVFDRLRSIRQDLIVQGNPEPKISIQILHICVRFHLIASYNLGIPERNQDENVEFDGAFNFTQLLECLKDLLIHYDETNKNEEDILGRWFFSSFEENVDPLKFSKLSICS